MSRRSSGATPAFAALERAGVAHTRLSYDHDPRTPSYGLEAAESLGVDPARVFKTLLVDLSAELAVGIVPVTAQLDLKAMATAAGAKKARMAEPAVAERTTGYVVGGISPLGQRKRLLTVIDSSCRTHEQILVSGGRRGLEAALAPDDLIVLIDARVADIADYG